MGPNEDLLVHAYETAPSAIRHSLSDGSAVDFIEKLPTRYDLHIDTVGYVAEFIRNMLLGFLKPEQFIQKLNSVGILDEIARKLTNDLNREVFIPLRDEIRNSTDSSSLATPSSVPHVQVMHLTQAESVNEARAVPAIAAPVPQIPKGPEAYKEITQPVEDSVRFISPEAPAQQAPIHHAAEPVVRTMQSDISALQSHVGVPSSIPFTPQASHATPAMAFQTASLPNVASFSTNSEPAGLDPMSGAAPVRYTGDPYRETV